ncbi:MAG: isopentenyl-diphosphate Delta-isomerase [Bacteroidia bacterium]
MIIPNHTTPTPTQVQELVVLVDENDHEIGFMEKMEAHEKAVLHRAFSLFVFNSKGEMLLQQRAYHKYHSGGLWTNACCSHPRPNEKVEAAAARRIQEEMGISCEEINYAFSFVYKAALDKNLTEHELDHVLIAYYEDVCKINKEEVADFQYVSIEQIRKDLLECPQNYTAWFKIIFERVVTYYQLIGK